MRKIVDLTWFNYLLHISPFQTLGVIIATAIIIIAIFVKNISFGAINLLFIYFMGYSLRQILSIYTDKIFIEKSFYLYLLLDIYLSIIFSIFIGTALSFLNILTKINVISSIYGIIIISLIIRLKFRHRFHENIEGYDHKLLLCIFLSMIIGLSFAIYWRKATMFPILSQQDEIIHILRSVEIARLEGISNIFLSSHFRPISFNILLTLLSLITGISPYLITWYSVFFVMSFYSILIYLFSYTYINNHQHSLCASLFATSVCGFWILHGPHYFLPDTVAIITMMLFITILEKLNYDSHIFWLISSLTLVSISLTYYYALIPFSPLIMMIAIRKRILKIFNIRWVRLLSILTICVLVYLAFYINSTYIGYLTPVISWSMALEIIEAAYSPFILILFIIGIVLAFRIQEQKCLEIACFSLFLTSIYFSPLHQTERVEFYVRPFIAFTSAIIFNLNFRKKIIKILNLNQTFLSSLIRDICFKISLTIRLKRLFNIRFKLSLNLFTISFLFLTSGFLISPYKNFVTENIPVKGWRGLPLRYTSKDLYDAGIWLKENSSRESYIISDVDTCRIIQAISERSGMIDSINFGYYLHLETWIIYDFLISNDIASAYDILKELDRQVSIENSLYVIISSSTAKSATAYSNLLGENFDPLSSEHRIAIRIWTPPETLKPFNGSDKFKDQALFKLVFDSKTVKIFLVNTVYLGNNTYVDI